MTRDSSRDAPRAAGEGRSATRDPRVTLHPAKREWPLLIGAATAALFLTFGESWLADLSHPVWFTVVLCWLFAAILMAAFAVVRHAEHLAVALGEPLGMLLFLAYLMLMFER